MGFSMIIDEKACAQFPMIRHAAEVGWIPVSPEEAKEKRGGVAGMLFNDVLPAKLAEFNPWLSPDSIRSVIESIEALSASIEGNREALSWLRGERQWYDEAEGLKKSVKLVDFETAAKNVLQCSWEWQVKPPARKGNRADLVFMVNGIPVCIVEHKNPLSGDALERGINQIRRYEAETPELLGTAQLFNVTHMLDYWYGVTWNVTRRDMARWKQAPEESYRFAVQSFFEPTDFLRSLERWILFYVQDGETRKSVLRQHQRRAIDAIVGRCADSGRTRGLVWHTQGSGKTFTLLTAARIILEDKARFSSATVITVVDRVDLEGQLSGWVERLLGELQIHDIATRRANSKADLQSLIEADFRGLVISTIQKFEGMPDSACGRDNVFVFIDEAHRSVAKDLGTYLMAALPRSTIIGFTGTPIANNSQGEGTFKIFGTQDEKGYLDKYSIVESIHDGTTLPIKHILAPSEMTVPAERLDEEFFALAESEGITDIDELNRVLDRAVGLRTFLSADDRIEKVAAFVAGHFKENVLPLGYKAFLVAVNREACAKYKIALDKHLPSEWSVPVYSENAGDKIDRPLVARLQLDRDGEADAKALFRKPAEDPKILIVTDKLLAGYDAPVLYCLYLDKPMRDHVLLQALARANRPYVDSEDVEKKVGLIVDFVGVLRELKKALRFDSDDVSGAIEDIGLLRNDFEKKMAAVRGSYLAEVKAEASDSDEALERIIFGALMDIEARKAFYEAYKEIESLWEILSPAPELRGFIDDYRLLSALYAAARNAFADKGGYIADLAHKTKRLIESSAMQEGLFRLTRAATFDAKTIEALRNEKGSDEGKVFNLVKGLRKEIEDDPGMASVLLPLKERAERIVKELSDKQIDAQKALDGLSELAAERESAMRTASASGLTKRGFAAYWTLHEDPALGYAGISAMEIAREAEQLMARYPNASVNPEENRRLRSALYRPLLALGSEERAGIVEKTMDALFGEGRE
jgi:type I restriction enzyme, R subunit